MEREKMLTKLRADRDAAAARGDHAEAMILNDRIQDLKSGSVTVEKVMQQFESALTRKRFYVPARMDLAATAHSARKAAERVQEDAKADPEMLRKPTTI